MKHDVVEFFLRTHSEVFETAGIIHKRLNKTHTYQLHKAIKMKGHKRLQFSNI